MVVVIGAGGLCCLGLSVGRWKYEVRSPDLRRLGFGSGVLQEIYD